MNIYQIQQDLLYLFDEIENNGGELTPELEDKLSITQDEFKNKVEDYTNVIKSLENDLTAITVEITRLKSLSMRKAKIIDKLKEIIINAIDEFGDTKKSGVKYVDYGTGEVSIRRTPVIKVDETLVKRVGEEVQNIITFNKEINQLNVADKLDLSDIVTAIAKDDFAQLSVGGDDLNHIDVDLSISVPLKDLANGKAYSIIRDIANYTDSYKLGASVSKTQLKADLRENGACAPNLAKLDVTKSLNIK